MAHLPDSIDVSLDSFLYTKTVLICSYSKLLVKGTSNCYQLDHLVLINAIRLYMIFWAIRCFIRGP